VTGQAPEGPGSWSSIGALDMAQNCPTVVHGDGLQRGCKPRGPYGSLGPIPRNGTALDMAQNCPTVVWTLG